MENTIIISIYDGIYGGYSAKIVNTDGVARSIFLQETVARELDCYALNFSYDESVVNSFLAPYAHAIICDNGKILIVK